MMFTLYLEKEVHFSKNFKLQPKIWNLKKITLKNWQNNIKNKSKNSKIRFKIFLIMHKTRKSKLLLMRINFNSSSNSMMNKFEKLLKSKNHKFITLLSKCKKWKDRKYELLNLVSKLNMRNESRKKKIW